MYIPTILAFFGSGFAVILAFVQDDGSPLNFLLPGIVIVGVISWLVFTLLFFLGNGYLCYALIKGRFYSEVSAESLALSKTRRFSVAFNTFSRIAILGLLFGGIITCDYLRLHRLEERHRYWVIQGQCEVLSITEPHTLLLRNEKGTIIECDVEKKTMMRLSKSQLQKEYPQIAEDIANDSLRSLASTKLRDYGGQDRSAVSPDNHWTVHSDNQGMSFFIASREPPSRIPLYHGMWIAFHRFTPDGKYLITQANADRIVLSDEPIKLDRIIIWKVPDLADEVSSPGF